MKLDINHAMPDGTCRHHVQIIPGGDFLMTTCVIKDNTKKTHQVRRVSARGNVFWRLDLKGTMTRPVIGKESLYFVHGSYLEDGARKCKLEDDVREYEISAIAHLTVAHPRSSAASLLYHQEAVHMYQKWTQRA